jgi:DNA-binding CsgD family transcriptional regulator
MRKIFGLDNCLVLLKKRTCFSEFFIFYGAVENGSIINFYLNQVGLLKKFPTSFVDDGKKLISKADAEKIVLAQPAIETKNQVTESEAVVAKLLFFGLSSTEIAEKLLISPRTVEHHVANMKKKFNCSKKSELIKALHWNAETSTLIE